MSDDLIEKIKAALSGTRQTDADDDDEPSGNKVPVDRFRAVVREKNEIKRQLADLASAVEAERKTAAKSIEEVKAAAAREVASLAAQHQEHLAARDLGFDEDGLVALRTAYQRLPEQGRPKSAVEWWRSVSADDKARETLPKTLQAYIPAAKDEAPPPKTRSAGVDTGARSASTKTKIEDVTGAKSMADLAKLLGAR
jgi:hypothetical protein